MIPPFPVVYFCPDEREGEKEVLCIVGRFVLLMNLDFDEYSSVRKLADHKTVGLSFAVPLGLGL